LLQSFQQLPLRPHLPSPTTVTAAMMAGADMAEDGAEDMAEDGVADTGVVGVAAMA